MLKMGLKPCLVMAAGIWAEDVRKGWRVLVDADESFLRCKCITALIFGFFRSGVM